MRGTGTAEPAGVTFPGAYKPNDPGILYNLYYRTQCLRKSNDHRRRQHITRPDVSRPKGVRGQARPAGGPQARRARDRLLHGLPEGQLRPRRLHGRWRAALDRQGRQRGAPRRRRVPLGRRLRLVQHARPTRASVGRGRRQLCSRAACCPRASSPGVGYTGKITMQGAPKAGKAGAAAPKAPVGKGARLPGKGAKAPAAPGLAAAPPAAADVGLSLWRSNGD